MRFTKTDTGVSFSRIVTTCSDTDEPRRAMPPVDGIPGGLHVETATAARRGPGIMMGEDQWTQYHNRECRLVLDLWSVGP
ncbi:MAG: hypothetical protein ABIU05_27630 [Nitrospirales bacterium]